MKISKSSLLVLAISAVGGALIYRAIQQNKEERKLLPAGQSPEEAEQEYTGNYDIDGVSYDAKGVIIGSDRHHVNSEKHPLPEEMH